MNLWHDVDAGSAEEMNVIVEIPQGSSNKYELDKDTGLIKLDRVNYGPTHYPVNYGFVPQTLWDDGDAVDVLLFSTFPLHPGVLVTIRPVGIMKMIDGGESDDKIIGVPAEDRRFENVKDVGDLNPHTLREIKLFFETIKQLKGKPVEVKVLSFDGVSEAHKAFAHARKLYTEKFAK